MTPYFNETISTENPKLYGGMMPGIPQRKIHKKLDIPPRNLMAAIVECGAEYATVVTDNWRNATCKKCQLNNPENSNAK